MKINLRHIIPIIILICLSAQCVFGQDYSYPKASFVSQLEGKMTDDFKTGSEVFQEGCIEGNCDNGKGKYYFSLNKAIYKGKFISGLPDGFGICSFENGEEYSGNWRQGFFHGDGTLTLSNGEQLHGLWNESVLQEKINKTELREQITHSTNDDSKGEIFAIVIGISNYAHMPTLKFSDDDAYKMYAHLKSIEGGGLKDENIRLLIDEAATKEVIENTFIDVFSHCSSEDMVFVYYSGHGLEDALLPIDYDGVSKKIYYQHIQEIVDNSEAKQKFLVVDACHSGSAFTNKNGLQKYKCFDHFSKGTIVLLSSKKEETSLESEGLRQGVFSHYLMKGMTGRADENSDQNVTISELYAYINNGVVNYTGGRQHPILKGNFELYSIVASARK